jgi:type II secretory pathway pseudopilin PulG
MKLLRAHKENKRAFTLAEMGVAVGVLGLLGLVFFQVLQSGLTLSAKNTAVNSAHEEARQGVLKLTRDLHASVSVPQLRDTSFAVVSSTPSPGGTPPTAAGVSFQNVALGPNYVFQDPGGSNGLIMIHDGAVGPSQGMRLIIPAWGAEGDIIKVSGSSTSGHSNVFTTNNLETGVKNSPKYAGDSYAITYYTNRVMYLVQGGQYVADAKGDFNPVSGQPGQYVQVTPGTGQYHFENGELHYYLQSSNATSQNQVGTLYWKDMGTIARFLSNPKPFSVPLNRTGGSDNRYVQVKISARDPKSSNRGYIATSSLLDTQIDYRSRLTVYQ